MTVTTEAIQTALKGLGSTPDAVRDTLVAGGYLGKPGQACNCPVSNYMTDKLNLIRGDSTDAFVQNTEGFAICSSSWSYRTEDEGKQYASSAHRMNPEAVSEFIWSFDAGRYPELLHSEYTGRYIDLDH